MIELMLTYVALILNLTIFVRLFTFRRGASRYRPVISLMAALTMGFSGSSVLLFAKGSIVVTPEQWPLLLMLAVVAAGVCRHQGNLARVVDQLAPWNGHERRRP